VRAPLARVAAVLSVSLVGVAGCSPAPSDSITVFAAASLERSFTVLADQFENEHPDTRVLLSFAGSSDLAAQIIEGAPADVFASADARTMATVDDAGLVRGNPVRFASNRLQIAVPTGNPASIDDLADLAADDVVSVVCAPQVPCGAATVLVERAAGIRIHPASEELSVTEVLGKVASGEADAGLVYVTDVLASEGRVLGIEFPESRQAVTDYLAAELTGSGNRSAARAFVEAVAGGAARSVLRDAGFGGPE
jgi:molybdate transport system substrate-binding protein